MKIRTLSLIIPILVLVAACASTASSPSAAAPSAAAPSAAPSMAASPSASMAPASVAPSEPPASVDPAAGFRDDTLQPLLDEITTALQKWGEAATAAAAPDAPDTAKIALAGAAFRVKVALQSATATLEAAEMPDCATPARDQAVTFIGELTSSSEDLLADNSASPDDVQAVIQQATDGLPALAEAVTTGCG